MILSVTLKTRSLIHMVGRGNEGAQNDSCRAMSHIPPPARLSAERLRFSRGDLSEPSCPGAAPPPAANAC